MGFLSGIIGAGVKTILTPVAIVKDVVNIATEQEVNSTKKLFEDAAKDLEKAVDDLGESELL